MSRINRRHGICSVKWLGCKKSPDETWHRCHIALPHPEHVCMHCKEKRQA